MVRAVQLACGWPSARRAGVVAFCLAAAASCDASQVAAPPAKLTVRVGGADTAGKGFVSWETPDRDATIITGPQGGQHIWVSVGVDLPAAVTLNAAVTLFREPTGTLAEALVKPGMVEFRRPTKLIGGQQVLEGVTAFVKEPCKINGQRVRVEVTAHTEGGRSGQAKAWIVPHYDGPCFP